MVLALVKRAGRTVSADTVALILFALCAGALTLLYEVVIAGLALGQWAGIRILYNALRFAGARICGKLTDKVRQHLLGTSRSRFRKAIADTIALSLYQLPIYVVSALIMGASIRQIAITSTIYLGDNVLLGWLYGVILDWVRRRFAKGGER